MEKLVKARGRSLRRVISRGIEVGHPASAPATLRFDFLALGAQTSVELVCRPRLAAVRLEAALFLDARFLYLSAPVQG
jgi:hypothetical protein